MVSGCQVRPSLAWSVEALHVFSYIMSVPPSHHPKASRAYFYTSFVAYILGLGTTIAVMHVFKAAQPALLYLVPSCLGLPFFLALLRGDIPSLLKYCPECCFTISNFDDFSLPPLWLARYRDYPEPKKDSSEVKDTKTD